MSEPFELLLFTSDTSLVSRCVSSDIAGIIVDWERQGKARRQAGADTQINDAEPADLLRVRAAGARRVLCRVNGPSVPTFEREIRDAVAHGADEILVPMVRTPADVIRALDAGGGEVAVGALIETDDAVFSAEEILSLPLSRAYVGLMDLSIARKADVFDAVADGTVERLALAAAEAGIPFGFAGVTLPDRGAPIPARLLLREMVRLGSSFGVLRRSFIRDTVDTDVSEACGRILADVSDSLRRDSDEVARDHAALMASLGRAEQRV